MSCFAHEVLVLKASYRKSVGGYFFYVVVPSIKDRDISLMHDQDFSTRNRAEHMQRSVPASPTSSEDLPGIQIALNAVNQIRAQSHFDATYIVSTADVELVA